MFDPFSSAFPIDGLMAALVLAALALAVATLIRRPRRRRPAVSAPTRRSASAGADLTVVGHIPTCIVPLLNLSERRVFQEIEALLREIGAPHRLFAQVALGEVINVQPGLADPAQRQSALNRINAKRLDFLIVDRDWIPVLAIEYHGSGHFRGNADARDAVKREACRAAGLPLIEIARSGMSPQQRDEITRRLGQSPRLAAE
jgi:hypothetical protein